MKNDFPVSNFPVALFAVRRTTRVVVRTYRYSTRGVVDSIHTAYVHVPVHSHRLAEPSSVLRQLSAFNAFFHSTDSARWLFFRFFLFLRFFRRAACARNAGGVARARCVFATTTVYRGSHTRTSVDFVVLDRLGAAAVVVVVLFCQHIRWKWQQHR